MQRRTTLIASPSRTKRWLVLLLVALMWMQFAGMLHKLAHAHHGAGAAASSQSLETFFPNHSQQSKQDCQLLDLQCGGVALSQVTPLLALPVFALQATWYKTTPIEARTRLHYLARAPPALI